ncbi:unnamed protein product [Ilex paraguariensis]|uniref:AAA+ ATPase domain-containing protein n=1 Tax=Ilex paraguariensis TaxID=185542 RepID=A0ABC8SKY0_9AQUA
MNISHFHLSNFCIILFVWTNYLRYESKFIQKIIEEVWSKVNPTFLNVAIHPVGIDSPVKDICFLLTSGPNDVRMIGILGMGGVGKTTIVKAVYNLIFQQFEGSCFLMNVREVSEQLNGLLHLQEQVLSEILRVQNLKIDNIDRGINWMKERLCSKRILLVLDDVDHVSQLNSLAGNRDWFGPGSRIIMTTRDEQLLNKVKVDEKYEAKGLKYDESLELFSWHAFKQAMPLEDYLDLSNGIVTYTKGLPLALEVLGSYLNAKSIRVWRSASEKLKQVPPCQIQKKLRISFDALDDDKIKDIFLDIACFFIGMDKDYVINILDGCGFFSEIGISVLINRCLLKVNEHNELRMHDLIRDMGREIIREESSKQPEKRSRLWYHEDVCDVLETHKVRHHSFNVNTFHIALNTHSHTHTHTHSLSLSMYIYTFTHTFVSLSIVYILQITCEISSCSL